MYVVYPDGTVGMIVRDEEQKAKNALVAAVDTTRETVDGYKKN